MRSASTITTKFAQDVLAILREAGVEILKIYDNEDLGVEYKLDDSPLTLADTASNKLILEKLAALTPEIPIISEEDIDETQVGDEYWLVDPLDGTKEFIKRNGEFTVMAALMQYDRPVLGVIHAPVKKIDFYGGRDVKPIKIVDGIDEPISVSDSIHDPLIVLASRSHSDDASQAFLDRLGEHEVTNIGSSFKFGQVADGTADLYVRYHPTMEWDTAAGQAIVEAAGGKLVGIDGKEFPYSKAGRLNGGFVVYNPLVDVIPYL